VTGPKFLLKFVYDSLEGKKGDLRIGLVGIWLFLWLKRNRATRRRWFMPVILAA
jgi:hypothetical protein